MGFCRIGDLFNDLPVENGEAHFCDKLRPVVFPGLAVVDCLQVLVHHGRVDLIWVALILVQFIFKAIIRRAFHFDAHRLLQLVLLLELSH